MHLKCTYIIYAVLWQSLTVLELTRCSEKIKKFKLYKQLHLYFKYLKIILEQFYDNNFIIF